MDLGRGWCRRSGGSVIRPLDPGSYTSHTAFYAALETRLREASDGSAPRWGLMRTQFAISRLLVRLQATQPDRWITKGGTSMLARLDGRCRLSRDLDLQCRSFADGAQEGLRAAADFDAGDWLRFQVVGDVRPLQQEEFRGCRFRMRAWIGVKQFAQFGIDVVDEMSLSGRIEQRSPYSPIAMVGVSNIEVPLYPAEDHAADKVSAMGKIRAHGANVRVSSRYRDLADLALLASSVRIESAPFMAALAEPARHWAHDMFGETGLRLPGPEWPDMYVKTILAEPLVKQRWPTAQAALAVAKPLVDPALAGTAHGTWDPAGGAWHAG